MPKKNKLKLLIASLVIVTGVIKPNYSLAQELVINNQLIAKKSGGRSSGGSFKSRPSRSSSPKRKSTPSRNNYNRRKSNSPSYRREPTRTYRNSQPRSYRNYGRSRSGGLGSILFLMIFLIIFGLIIYLLYQMLSKGSKSGNKINRERDNDRVTVSILQVALSNAAENIQEELSTLSLNANTDTESGLVDLMQESALILLRNSHAWSHVLTSSTSLDISQAESAFSKLSIRERSKFSSETLSNIDGKVKTKDAKASESDDFAAYVVVTLILGTADDQPLFSKINTEETLNEAILKLSSMREDYLFKFELLWTPQQAEQYLTDEELLLEYTDIIPLA